METIPAPIITRPKIRISFMGTLPRCRGARPDRYPRRGTLCYNKIRIQAIGGNPQLETIDIARRIADIASEKQASDIIVTDVRGLSSLTDYQVVLSADTTRLARAILDEVSDKLKKEGQRPLHTEGIGPDQDWLIIDYGPVMMHVFTPEKRSLYDFDRLWPQAKTVLALQ